MSKLMKLSITCLLIFNIFSVGVLTVSATEPLLPEPKDDRPAGCPADTTNCGNYTLNDMVGVALKISEFILSIVGSLALLAFIYGGIMWMISAGDAEKVMTGKRAIIGAVVGLTIVFTSYMIIQLVYTALGITKTSTGGWAVTSWSVSNWFK